jgi:hypothetical protein
MKVTNKETGKDITGLVIQLLEGKITKRKFEQLSKLSNK